MLVLFAAALSEQQARELVPRADLSGLNDAQRGAFYDVAKDVFNYAGCDGSLARCLAAGEKDPHALRMAALVKQLVLEGFPPEVAVKGLEDYYASFEKKARQPVNADNCGTLGKGPVAIVEFSDYQCPHCAHAVAPLHDLVTRDAKGQAKLCSKYFPFPSHPRARVAAGCVEYARQHGKFWELNDQVFAHQEALEDSDLEALARSVGLDGKEMLKQVYAHKFDAIIEKHLREGTSAGVQQTPALFFNGRALALPPRPYYLKHTVEDELEWSKKRAWTFSKPAKASKSRP